MRRVTALHLSQALSAAGTVDEVASAIRELLPAVLDAAEARLGIVDHDARVLRLHSPDGTPEHLRERYGCIPLDEPTPLTEIVRTGELLVLRDHDDWRAHAPPSMVEDVIAAGLGTTMCAPLTDPSGRVVGILAVSWARVVDVDDAAITVFRTIAELCEQTLARATSTDQATARTTKLALLAEHLADAMSMHEVLETVTVMGGSPVDAIATSIGLCDPDAGVPRTHHGDSVDDEVRRRYADPPLSAPLAFTEAARTGEAIYLEDRAAYLARYPESTEGTARLGSGARAALPVRTAGGDPIGSIVHAWAGPRTFDPALVSTLTTISDMAGQAIERTRLIDQIRRQAGRSDALAGLAELLATARTSNEVAGVVALHAAPVSGADAANIALLDPEAGELRIHHQPAVDITIKEKYRTLALDARVPHADVLREGGDALLFEDLDAFGDRYPHLLDDLKEAGRQSCAVVALRDSRGAPLGAVGFSWNEPTRFDADARAALHGVAGLCSQALERAQQSDAEHRLVTTLRDSILTPLPSIAGLDVAGRYLPAAQHIGMGGDWYQAIAVDARHYALIVGDVAGHGITAIGEMAELQAVIGALVRLGLPLGDVFRQATNVLRARTPTVTATALVAVVDTATDTLTYAAAGHPPPVLRTPDGDTLLLDGGRHPLLGISPAADPAVGTHPFPTGSVLIAYTDGLIERRTEPIDLSIERLAAQIAAASARDPEGLADDLLLANLAGREPDDDVALVVVTRTE